MQVLPHHLERNRKGKSSHSEQEEGDQNSWYLYINEDDLPPGERVDCEMKLGSVVFFNNTIPHCSGDNTYQHLSFYLFILDIYIFFIFFSYIVFDFFYEFYGAGRTGSGGAWT